MFHCVFLLNPVRFAPDEHDATSLGTVVCERTRLEGEPGRQQAVGTGELVQFPAQLALVSAGYKGIAIPGLNSNLFDCQRGLVINYHGKVEDAFSGLAGLYVAGWLKRGPSGIIGTNIADAKDTVGSILKDMENYVPKKDTATSLTDILKGRQVKVVDWDAYQRIVEFENEPERKRSKDQPREKISTREGLLNVAFGT